MDETDIILEIKELRRKQLQIETKYLGKIPFFKSPNESNVDHYLAQAEDIFNTLDYSDDIRIIKIGEKLDPTLQSWFTSFKCNDSSTWNDFKNELPNCLQSPSLLITLHGLHVTSFSGKENARQWFIQIDTQFSELRLSSQGRLKILPYFFVGDVIIWYRLNQHQIRCYVDFCRLFVLKYITIQQLPYHYASVKQETKSALLHSPIVINDNLVNNTIDRLNDETTSPICHSISSSDPTNALSSNPALSPTISKALIDRFIKEPVTFFGGKENICTWLYEIKREFKTINFYDLDKFNLIHVCPSGEAHPWYIQSKQQITSSSIFVHEITKSFTSNLQCDLVFKQYHHTMHQSAAHYYTQMVKLIKQAIVVLGKDDVDDIILLDIDPLTLRIETVGGVRKRKKKKKKLILSNASFITMLDCLSSCIRKTFAIVVDYIF